MAILALFSVPTLAFAQQSYTPLSPLPGTTAGNCAINPTTGYPDPDCKSDLSNYLPGLFSLVIGVAGALAVIMIVIGGIEYLSTDSMFGKEGGKEKIKNAVWGLILAIGAYAILNTISPRLVNFSLILSSIPPPATTTPVGGGSAGCVGTNSCVAGDPWPDDSFVRLQKLLSGGNIPVNKNNCKTVGETNCTSVYGLGYGAIDGVIQLKRNCEAQGNITCSVVVTGGTEYWLHGSQTGAAKTTINLNTTGHKPGNSVVDISSSYSNLNDFITDSSKSGSYKRVSCSQGGCTCSNKGPGWLIGNAVYVRESSPDHWHVCFSSSTGGGF
ncbi:MAG: hypothetical protein A2653_02060 [Candidatus Zambryskibacteria bacterium RIFCSPHIGHO2_01_FULL_43_25]|nr:MAG: hypothetical protein A2653_02060 [Candidatus Zambryskibacteria bacterium RIFCSPHIGHO2_01_FULL_43_25]